jgi:mannitol-1-phosphate 5-dehydrogenase
MNAATWQVECPMAFTGTTRFAGFGFGAIQAGLFLYEAYRCGQYSPPLVVDVRADLVESLRSNAGHYSLNIARRDRIDTVDVGPVAVADSTQARDRTRIVEAISSADEASTALPSIDFYRTDQPSSPHLLLGEGLTRRRAARPLVVFCAENHRRAGALLEEAVLESVSPPERDRIRRRARFVDTVIGKMSGVVTEQSELLSLGLAPVTPSTPAAFLVEEFNHILTSRIGNPGRRENAIGPMVAVLRPVHDLAPFAAAKLFGHNATHALAAYLGRLLGLRLMADLTAVPGAMAFLRAAFLDESGRALVRRYRAADPLFTPFGFEGFADDLLVRMVNPFLADTIERAARDPVRKLGWDDRLIGTIRLGRDEGIPMPSYAMGAAAALADLDPEVMTIDPSAVEQLLRSCWPDGADLRESQSVVELVQQGLLDLRRWLVTGFDGNVFSADRSHIATGLITRSLAMPQTSRPRSAVSLRKDQAATAGRVGRKCRSDEGDRPDVHVGGARSGLTLVNTHVHLPPNFSAFDSPEQAVRLAAAEGVWVVGSSNYYDFRPYRRFAAAAAEAGVMPLYGLEINTVASDLVGMRINDPSNPGRFNLCGKGLTRFDPPIDSAARRMAAIRGANDERMRSMTARLSELFGRAGLDGAPTYGQIVATVAERCGVPADWVSLQERHLAEAFQEVLFSAVPAEQRVAVLGRMLPGFVHVDTSDEVAVQETIRSSLMKFGMPAFVPEVPVSFDDGYQLILELGGIPCYPIFADAASTISDFEDPPEALARRLLDRAIYCAELFPVRNRPEVVDRYVEVLRRAGIVVMAGTDHNTKRMIPLALTVLGGAPLSQQARAAFWEATCIVAAHQELSAAGRPGYVDDAGRLATGFDDCEGRIGSFARIGARTIAARCGATWRS